MIATQLTSRDRTLANAIWRNAPIARAQLHLACRIHPNQVGISVARLMELGLVREGAARAEGRGRPLVPLEVNTVDRQVVGVALIPGRAEVSVTNLGGDAISDPIVIEKKEPEELVDAAADALRSVVSRGTSGVGVSFAGLYDPKTHALLVGTGSGMRSVSLDPLGAAAGNNRLTINNDQHALIARWLLTHRTDPREDLLLVGFDDGRMGAALVVGGRPSQGCVMSGNELGHTTLAVDAPVCFCGQTGCLERICSSGYVKFKKGRAANLGDLLDAPSDDQALFDNVTNLVGAGFANAVNFARPHRLILASPLATKKPFADALPEQIRHRILPGLTDRVKIEWWNVPIGTSAQNAAWLAIASIFYDGWLDLGHKHEKPKRLKGKSPTPEEPATAAAV